MRTMRIALSQVLFFVALALVITFTGAPVAIAQDNQPAIQDFKFTPAKVNYGDTLKYSFTYKNFPGGLAAVKDVEMWILWLAPGHSYVRSRYAPRSEELVQHTAEKGTFESRVLPWLPPQKDPPYGGVDVQYTLKMRTADGKKVEGVTIIRFE